MIDIHVSLALNLLDGFSGRPLKPAQVRLFLDEEPCRPVYKEGGWFVLVNLAAYLTGSLAASGEPVHLMLEKGLQADQLQRLWGGGNKPYKLSFGCLVNTVLIDSERVRSVARVKQIRIQTEDSSK